VRALPGILPRRGRLGARGAGRGGPRAGAGSAAPPGTHQGGQGARGRGRGGGAAEGVGVACEGPSGSEGPAPRPKERARHPAPVGGPTRGEHWQDGGPASGPSPGPSLAARARPRPGAACREAGRLGDRGRAREGGGRHLGRRALLAVGGLGVGGGGRGGLALAAGTSVAHGGRSWGRRGKGGRARSAGGEGGSRAGPGGGRPRGGSSGARGLAVPAGQGRLGDVLTGTGECPAAPPSAGPYRRFSASPGARSSAPFPLLDAQRSVPAPLGGGTGRQAKKGGQRGRREPGVRATQGQTPGARERRGSHSPDRSKVKILAGDRSAKPAVLPGTGSQRQTGFLPSGSRLWVPP